MSDSSSGDPGANPVPLAVQADYTARLRLMQPRGRIWDGPYDNVMGQLRQGQTALLASFSSRLTTLTETESYPPTSIELLPAWEMAFGLPNPCMAANPTVTERQQALAAKLAQSGGLSKSSIIKIMAALGYSITITTFKPARYGYTNYGDTYAGPDWGFTWQVNAPQFVIEYATYGSGSFGDYYATWGSTELQCMINQIAPPHTIVIFNYS